MDLTVQAFESGAVNLVVKEYNVAASVIFDESDEDTIIDLIKKGCSDARERKRTAQAQANGS